MVIMQFKQFNILTYNHKVSFNYKLDEFETENGFKDYLEEFNQQDEYDTLVIQCNHKNENLGHILHAQHIMEMRDTKQISRDDVEENRVADNDDDGEDKASGGDGDEKKPVAVVVADDDVIITIHFLKF